MWYWDQMVADAPPRDHIEQLYLIPEEDRAWLETRSLRRELRVGDVRSVRALDEGTEQMEVWA